MTGAASILARTADGPGADGVSISATASPHLTKGAVTLAVASLVAKLVIVGRLPALCSAWKLRATGQICGTRTTAWLSRERLLGLEPMPWVSSQVRWVTPGTTFSGM